jgi:hypothetical protein
MCIYMHICMYVHMYIAYFYSLCYGVRRKQGILIIKQCQEIILLGYDVSQVAYCSLNIVHLAFAPEDLHLKNLNIYL